MACGCRGGSRKGPAAGEIIGFDYIDPSERTTTRFMLLAEARAEQRTQGGGTIRTIRRGTAA